MSAGHWLDEPTPIDQHILTLRRGGMPYRSIALAITHFTGVRLSEDQTRRRARHLGAPRMESKVRA